MNHENNSQENYSSGHYDSKEEDNEDDKIILTPMSDVVIYDDKIYEYGIDKKLIPIGHPNPIIGTHYNCHGWALGYKEWINISHNKTDDISLSERIATSCKDKGITEEDSFTYELSTYAHSETKKLINTNNEGCRVGAIAAYYKNNSLTHTARYKKSLSNDAFTWSSKLGDGHVVEHQAVEDLIPIYGDIIDFYNVEL